MLDANEKLHVTLIKLPHHGSDRNIDYEFFTHITADIYAASGDGSNGNPDYKTLKWLVTAAKAQNRRPQIVVTNRTGNVKKILRDYPPSKYGYRLRTMRPQWHSTKIGMA